MLSYELISNRILLCSLLHFHVIFLLVGSQDVNMKDYYPLHKNCEAAIHKQIDQFMRASLVYTTMAAHFRQNTIARPGFAEFFTEKSEEQKKCADELIDYLNIRGGQFIGFKTKMPVRHKWKNGLEALLEAASLEELVNNKLHHLYNIAVLQCEDPHLTDYIEKEFFEIQVQSIDELHRHISELKAMDTAMGEYLFDKHFIRKKTEL